MRACARSSALGVQVYQRSGHDCAFIALRFADADDQLFAFLLRALANRDRLSGPTAISADWTFPSDLG